MENPFLLVGVDDKGLPGAPIAKRRFGDYDEACDHARIVLSSGGNLNLSSILIMQAVAVAQRTSPPVEITPLDRKV